jgi:hypothetical protein
MGDTLGIWRLRARIPESNPDRESVIYRLQKIALDADHYAGNGDLRISEQELDTYQAQVEAEGDPQGNRHTLSVIQEVRAELESDPPLLDDVVDYGKDRLDFLKFRLENFWGYGPR